MRSIVASHPKFTTTKWEPSSKLILLQLNEKLPKNSTSTILWLLAIWSKLERWKSSISECLMSEPQIKEKKIIVLKWHLLLFYTTTMNHFSIGLWHAMKSGFYMTTSNDELSGWTKKKLQSTSQSQTCTTKRSWSLFGGLLPIQSTTALWTPAKPLYLRSMLSKSMRCTETCQQNGRGSSPWQHQPHVAQPMLQKLNYQVLTHPLYSPDHLPTNYHSFNHLDNLLQGKIFPQSAGGRKCFPRVPWILQHRFLCYMNKLFFVGKNMLIVMVLVLINEDVFEPSYNDLKLMVWNHNYLCTNLIHKDYR